VIDVAISINAIGAFYAFDVVVILLSSANIGIPQGPQRSGASGRCPSTRRWGV
jgi:hypothetical protein